MMHKAWSSIQEVLYCFSRSYVKLQGHTAKKIVDFDPNWAFPGCNSNFNSPMATKWCIELETAKERCPIFFQGHPSNFKVTRYKASPILTQIGRFGTIGRSQLSNPSDLPCFSFESKYPAHSYLCTHFLQLYLNDIYCVSCIAIPICRSVRKHRIIEWSHLVPDVRLDTSRMLPPEKEHCCLFSNVRCQFCSCLVLLSKLLPDYQTSFTKPFPHLTRDGLATYLLAWIVKKHISCKCIKSSIYV